MALKITSPPFTIFAPPPCSGRTSTTEVRFSRWNNANAQPFIEHQRSIKEIEDDIRITRRYGSISKIVENASPPTNGSTIATTKSIGTPSAPSRSSIRGRCSKYSKDPKREPKYPDPDDDSILGENPNPVDSNLKQNPELSDDPDSKQNQNRNLHFSHPAFRKVSRVSNTKIPIVAQKHVKIGKNGVSYRIPNAPFEFQYSYTETPKVKPVALREPPFVPFGPTTMSRPWTGKAPLPGTKKKLPEFDSFRLPPPHKKGVKPVQAPGPFLAGSGPKYASTREEILGEPLTQMEKNALIVGTAKSRRQLNMGRDGLTHNMLENIHALWKRRRVCKIKCKGVCTVDMNNIFEQVEEKTGGKIIHSKGGVLYLFRGRNYNYMTRPRYPLMLWKPVTPVYPRLILQAPEGLTVQEANALRKRGRQLLPICKLGKNGVYSHLVSLVREAFEECELVRINCQGMNASDYKKIAAKLKDLVPCVLMSFESEHILLWRGRDWTPTLKKLKKKSVKVDESEMPGEIISTFNNTDSLPVEHQDASDLLTGELCNKDLCLGKLNISVPLAGDSANVEGSDVLPHSASNDKPSEATDTNSTVITANETSTSSGGGMWTNVDDSKASSVLPMVTSENDSATILESLGSTDDKSEAALASPRHLLGLVPASDTTMNHAELQIASEGSSSLTEFTKSSSACTEGVLQLRDKAIKTGNAVILDDVPLDANIVYDRAVALAKVAPPGPIFMLHTRKKVLVEKSEKQDGEDLNVEAIVVPVSGTRIEKKSSRNFKIKHLEEVYPEILPHGNLGVDELAKLLA